MNLLAKGKALRDRLMRKSATPLGTLSWVTKAKPDKPVDLTGLAWFGNTKFTRLPNEGGSTVVFGDADLLLPRDAIAAEPVDGDRLEWTFAGVVITYELLTPTGEPAWRWSDPERTAYRLHLKEVT